jgi:hypothetical protein
MSTSPSNRIHFEGNEGHKPELFNDLPAIPADAMIGPGYSFKP